MASARRCDGCRQDDETGTTITFLPDLDVFEEIEFDDKIRRGVCREMAFHDEDTALSASSTSARKAGKRSSTSKAASATSSPTRTRRRTRSTSTSSTSRASRTPQAQVEIAMQWNASYVESIFSFANNINTHEGGSHLSGFRAALTGTLNRYAKQAGLLKDKEDDKLEGEDVREGPLPSSP